MNHKPARLDADRTAKPLTKIVGHTHDGERVGPGLTTPDTYIGDDGTRTPLAPAKDPTRWARSDIRSARNFVQDALDDPDSGFTEDQADRLTAILDQLRDLDWDLTNA